jgi:hypothetical protein
MQPEPARRCVSRGARSVTKIGLYSWRPIPFCASNIALFTVAAIRMVCGLPSVLAIIASSITSFHTSVSSTRAFTCVESARLGLASSPAAHKGTASSMII